MSFEGSLRETPMRLVLDAIGSERQTGILTIQDAQEIVAVTFLRGEIVGADTLSGGDEILGQALAEAHVVRPDEFAAVVAIHRTGGGRVSDLLLERGLLDRTTLLGALRTQSLVLLRNVMHWTDGSYKFYTGEDLSFEEGFDPIDVDELLGHGGSFGASARGALEGLGTDALDLFGAPEPEPPLPAPSGVGPQSAYPPRETPPASPALAVPLPQSSPTAAPRLTPPVPAAPVAPAAAAPVAAQPPAQTAGQAAIRSRPAEPAAPQTDSAAEQTVHVDRAKALRPTVATAAGPGWRPAYWLAGGLLLPLVLTGFFPERLQAPLPWAKGVYRELRDTRRQGVFRRIDAAARTYCLVEGKYPSALDVLVQQGLLDSADLQTAGGDPVLFSGSGDSYALRTTQGALISGDASVESTAGNIFLDAAFSENAGIEGKPLVLLD